MERNNSYISYIHKFQMFPEKKIEHLNYKPNKLIKVPK